jgi:hypothetical protein
MNVFVDTLRNAQVTYTAPGASHSTTTKWFTDVAILNSSLGSVAGTSSVSFQVSCSYETQAFAVTNTSVSVSVPNIQTSQSVTGTSQLFAGGH